MAVQAEAVQPRPESTALITPMIQREAEPETSKPAEMHSPPSQPPAAEQGPLTGLPMVIPAVQREPDLEMPLALETQPESPLVSARQAIPPSPAAPLVQREPATEAAASHKTEVPVLKMQAHPPQMFVEQIEPAPKGCTC